MSTRHLIHKTSQLWAATIFQVSLAWPTLLPINGTFSLQPENILIPFSRLQFISNINPWACHHSLYSSLYTVNALSAQSCWIFYPYSRMSKLKGTWLPLAWHQCFTGSDSITLDSYTLFQFFQMTCFMCSHEYIVFTFAHSCLIKYVCTCVCACSVQNKDKINVLICFLARINAHKALFFHIIMLTDALSRQVRSIFCGKCKSVVSV